MKKKADWMPGKRVEQLKMAENWDEHVDEINDVLNIPLKTITDFKKAISTAKTAIAVPEGMRSAVTNAQLRVAFDVLTVMMRDIKKRYFFEPPLTAADFAALGLKPKDTIPTPIGNPVGLVTATIKYPNEAAIELHIKHVETTPFDERANYGVKIRYGVFGVDEPLPTDAKQLTESRFTRKKKELVTFDRKERQKTACFCLRYENSKGNAGQWSNIILATIP